ncbi:MAG: hypothetical protein A3B94_02575 [Candidatus Jacksonbacteria bacterium RIFCSPHIGHO2_02_FULL_43_10]|nr:MAG: hypothetical protein A3B94_02575 [Candidatus Jacksonbacteria bacterium RIFCSPHIGHO2_02_FULL_43_10]
MMLTLNLIPQQFKRELSLHATYILLKKIFILLFVVLCVSSVSLVSARMYLKQKLNELTIQTQAISFKTKDIKEKVTTLNALLKGTRNALESTQSWADILTAIESHIPMPITVNEITLEPDKTIHRIKLIGTSLSRDEYLEFERNIKTLPFVTSITSPVQNILSTGENAFTLTLIIQPSTLTQ